MLEEKQKTTYQFQTSSKSMASTISLLSEDQKCRELVMLFAQIQSRKRRNTILRVARYLQVSAREVKTAQSIIFPV